MKLLKLICFFIFLNVSFAVIPEEIISEMWLKNQVDARKIIRQRGQKNDLGKQDAVFLDSLEKAPPKGDDASLAVKEELAASYLREIIFENKQKLDFANIVRAFDFLLEKINDKKYFVEFSAEISRSDVAREPIIIKKILDGFAGLMDNHGDKIFVKYSAFKKNVDYFIKRKNSAESEFVINAYVSFLRKYIALVENERIYDVWRNEFTALCEDLDLGSEKSFIEKFVGGQELKEEFYFYNMKKG